MTPSPSAFIRVHLRLKSLFCRPTARELAALRKCIRVPDISDDQMMEQFRLAPESKMFAALSLFLEQEIQGEINSATVLALPPDRKMEHLHRAAGMIHFQSSMLTAVQKAASRNS